MSESRPEPASAAASAAALIPNEPAATARDAHGFDIADYDWIPVKRRRRPDGWSLDRQRRFIEALADTACVTTAAREAGMTVQSAYRLRRSPGAESFAAAWEAAIEQATRVLVDTAFDRAIHGSDEPVFDKSGRRVGRRMRQNDRLLMFLLRAHMPDRYGHAHRSSAPPPATATPLAARPIALAIEALAPVTPDNPGLLMTPDDLETALDLADVCDGTILPHRLREPDEEWEKAMTPTLGGSFGVSEEEDDEDE